MTNNPSLLSSSSPYSGLSQVMVDNGNLLSILSTCTSFLPTSSKTLRLNNVLYVTSLQKNLMFVHRLCVNNNCFVQFTKSIFFVKNKNTKQVLLHCTNNGSLGPVRSTSRRSHHIALSNVVSLLSLWHRLGNPGKRSLAASVRRGFINCNSSSGNSSCNVCHLGKPSKLQFPLSPNIAPASFILLNF